MLVNFIGLTTAISLNAHIHILLRLELADGLWIQINQDCKLCFACLFLLFQKAGHKRRRLYCSWREGGSYTMSPLPVPIGGVFIFWGCYKQRLC